jgi:hypothetical protein
MDRQAASLLRTVATRPDLAALLKRIFIYPYLLKAVPEEEDQAVLEEVLHPAAAPGVILRLSEYLDPFDEFFKRIYHRKGASLAGWKLIGVLMVLVPNLEWLSLQVADVGGIPAIAFMALYCHGIPRSYSRILTSLVTSAVMHMPVSMTYMSAHVTCLCSST